MSSSGVTDPEAQLVGTRFGLIRKVTRNKRVPGLPRSYRAYTAFLGYTERFAPWSVDTYAFGSALDDDLRARRAAIGEAVERYCGNVVPDNLLAGSFESLARVGAPVVDPQKFALYSAAQYATPGFPFVPLTRDLEISWVPGNDLVSGAEVLLPASLVYLNYFRGAHQAEPRTNSPVYAGIAAGETLEQAQRFALEEVLERDASAIWWLSGSPAVGIDCADHPEIRAVFTPAEVPDLAVSFLQIRSPFGVPVVGVFVEDTARSLVALGSACRATAVEVTKKALTEAFDVLSLSVALLDPDGILARATVAGDPHYRPYRADRAYLDDFRADWRDVTDLPAHAQLYLDVRMQGSVLDRMRSPALRTTLGDLSSLPETAGISHYLTRFGEAGLRAYAVDVTTTDVALAGLRVARVVVPGLYTNAPAAFPLLGGTRLYDEPVNRGWINGPLAAEKMVLTPIPHT